MKSRFSFDLDYCLISISLLLIRLPYFLGFGDSPLANLVCLLPFILTVVRNLLILTKTQRVLKTNKNLLIAFIIYLVFLAVAFLRSGLSDRYSLLATMGKYFLWVTLSVYSFLTFSRIDKSITYLNAVFNALILYVLVNLLAYLFGFQNPQELFVSPRPALMLKSLNITMNRISFPFSGGINTFASVAAGGLVVSALKSIYSPRRGEKVLAFLSALLCLGSIFATDSRGALVFAFFTIFLAVIFPYKAVKAWRWLPLLAPLIPLIVIFLQKSLPYDLFFGLLRNTSTPDLDFLSGRPQIWTIIMEQFSNFELIHLVGYGFHGQVLSGLSQNYAFLFLNFIFSDTASAHNFYLQTVLDVGYLGLLVVFWLNISLSFRMAKQVVMNPKNHLLKSTFFLFFYFVLAGTTETILSPDHVELFIVFIFLWGAALVNLPQKLTPSVNEPITRLNSV